MKIDKQNNSDKEIAITRGVDNSINVRIFNNKILMGIAGSFDNNLKELEKISGSKIYFRGNSIAIKGDKHKNEKVKDAIEYLIKRFRSDKKIDGNDIIASLNKYMVEDIKNQSTVRTLEEVIKTPKRSVIPRSLKQKEYVKSLRTKQIVMSLGPAGTGKTYLAVAVALSMLLEKKVESEPIVVEQKKESSKKKEIKTETNEQIKTQVINKSISSYFDLDGRV